MNKFFCISALVCLTSMVVALPSGAWNAKSSSGWTTEAAWKDENVKNADALGQGWISSESGEDLRPKSIPTSWQKVRKQNTDWVKSSGWDEKKSNNAWDKSALNPPSQEIAKGLIVKHPLPKLQLSGWSKSLLPAGGWDKKPTAEDWKQASVIKSAAPSGWNTKSASSGWEKDAASSKKSAADYAAANAAHAEYQKQAALLAWQKKHASTSGWEEKSAANDWQKETSSEEAWQKNASPLAWNDVPAGWEKETTNAAASSGWDADSDFKAWQKETASNGWDMSTSSKAWLKDAVASGWEKDAAVDMWQKNADPNVRQRESAASGWEKNADSAANGGDDKKNPSASEVYNKKNARGPAPSKWEN